MKAGLPLHFLAQIDLAEMPWLPDPMPKRGTLLFFAAMSDDHYASVEPGGGAVLFDPESCGTPTAAPSDLPPRSRTYDFDHEMYEADDPVALLYPHWPLKGYLIQSIPDPHAFDDNAYTEVEYADYCEAFPGFKADQVLQATGMTAPRGDLWQPVPIFTSRENDGPAALLPFEQTGFPWTNRGYALIAGKLLRQKVGRTSAETEDLQGWRAKGEADPHARVDPDEAQRFIARLNAILASDVREVERRGVTYIQPGAIGGWIALAVRSMVTEAGADPILAAALPDTVYASVYRMHSPLDHHQMFGHVGAAQIPLSADSRTITLLQLQSDRGGRMIIGDGGELDFRIAPEALAEANWSAVTLESSSH